MGRDRHWSEGRYHQGLSRERRRHALECALSLLLVGAFVTIMAAALCWLLAVLAQAIMAVFGAMVVVQ